MSESGDGVINLSRVRTIMPAIIDQLDAVQDEGLAVDLRGVRAVVGEIQDLIDDLDGVDLDERTAIGEQSGGQARKQRARLSQNLNLLSDRFGYAEQLVRIQSHSHDELTWRNLNLLSDRFGLGEQLVRVQYWAARGHDDPAAPHTTDGDGLDRFQPVLTVAPADGSDGDGSH